MERLNISLLQKYLPKIVSLGFISLWLIAMLIIWRNGEQEGNQARLSLRQDAVAAMHSKAIEIEGILQRTYHTIRTISLLPGVRSVEPYNRKSDAEDIVEGQHISRSDLDTIQQLYNHIAASVAVSEIYIIHDGFDPVAGEVPFIMFDNVIVDRYQDIIESHAESSLEDFPVEDETEEYEDYVRQLDYFRGHARVMPQTAPEGIYPINSGMVLTCDNTQYHSISKGDPINAVGFAISVPIYNFSDSKFKGLVTAVLRSNVLEAALLGWPVLPITESDKLLLKQRRIDTEAVSDHFILEEKLTNIAISDRRIPQFTSTADATKASAMQFQTRLNIDGPHEWILRNYVPLSTLKNALSQVNTKLAIQISLISLTILIFWLFVYRTFMSQRNSALQLHKLANIDSLTNLPNRRMLNQHMKQVLRQTRGDKHFAIIMVDVDYFKHVNDSLGHHAGDTMLVEIATRFHDTLRGADPLLGKTLDYNNGLEALDALNQNTMVDLVGRLGGDEFLVVLSGQVSHENALKVAQRLQDSLKVPILAENERIYASCSMGIALFPDHGLDTETLLRNADTAVYEAKRRGRSQTVSFESTLSEQAMRRLQMLAGLHEALQNSEFELWYQPVLHIKTQTLSAAEALLRWRNPQFGLVMPMDFVPLLEESGLIIPVGFWIIETACNQLKKWSNEGIPLDSISVNIAPQQLLHDGFVETLSSIIEKSKIVPSSLVIEITESTFMKQPEKAINTLVETRKLGVKIAIDDFGTGYSSLSYLQRLPLDILKIDRSFVNNAGTEIGAAICEILVRLANRLNLKVIAEGIETEQQYDILSGADWIQGYLISRPLSASDFLRTLNEYEAVHR